MNKARDLKHIVLGAVMTASGLSALAAVNLTTFAPGTPIKSNEVNANFSSLGAAIQALEAPIGVSRLAVTGTAADGKVLKLQAGNLAWADDLLGNGGSTYSADGSSLTLSGTTFSVKDGGVTAGKLSATGGADGKVLKLSGGNLVWGDDLAGSSLTADGTSLSLNGTVFSVKDGGVSGTKLAPGSVNDTKLVLPLFLSKSTFSPILRATNTDGQHGLEGVSGDPSLNGSPNSSIGVWGDTKTGYGVVGTSTSSFGVVGRSESSVGVQGSSTSGPGISGSSSTDVGVQGSSSSGIAVYGQSTTGKAAVFSGGSGGSGSCTYSGGANWTCTSDRNKKENFRAVNARAVLEALSNMPVTRWNMKGDANRTPHMGPVAQDFKAAFGLGEGDTTINTADAQGVALAAIKGLYGVVKRKDAKIATLSSQVASLEARLAALEKAVGSK